MLLLFDIDGTLVTTSGVGIRAMGLAGRSLYGNSFDASIIEYAGRLDPLIILDLLTRHELPTHDSSVSQFHAAYREHLEVLLREHNTARPCPGVLELLDILEADEAMTLGLLTGNFPDTGSIKLRASGIEPDRFPVHVWGMDSPHHPPCRTHLPPIGMARYEQREGRPPRETIVIGDTPHDINCAHVNGCRCIAVATGRFSVEELSEAGGDLVVRDLSETHEILDWIRSVPRSRTS